MPLPAEVIRAKRLGQALGEAQIEAFVQGLTDRSWSEGQIAALAMAICLNGMDRAETVALTRAMTRSGTVLDWSRERLPGPVVDKHSTGGIGDKVSLLLAPIVAACGGVLPMVSGRGLGHTGGTLDKLEALPGYTVAPPRATLRRVLREAGCAIVGASTRLAPADRRLYAIRDVTATVESVALITASILSKKLAAGVRALVMDVKVGNGAFCPTLPEARALARSLVEVARGAGLPTRALVTDMSQCLGQAAGNALEVQECLALLAGAPGEPRLMEVTLALCAELLHLAGLAESIDDGRRRAREALAGGAAAERFARMVAALGGPRDVFAWQAPAAPLIRPLPAPRDGVLAAMDTRALGLVIVALGGGRARPGDPIDPRVGLSKVLPLGTRVRAGEPLLRVHAARAADWEAVQPALAAALCIDDEAAPPAAPVIETLE